MTLSEIAAELETEAKRIRDLERHERLPVQAIDLNGARAKLKAALDGEDFTIGLNVSETKTYRGKETACKVQWIVTIAYKNHYGPTLASAVNAALASLEPEPAGNLATEVAIVEEAFAEPLPM
jgi:hypothetical protein